MKQTFIFGHRNPDTDSICASIALSNLKNMKGQKTKPVRLGDINNETKFALEYFNVDEPDYLNDVKLQLNDVDYIKNFYVKENMCLFDAYNLMLKESVSGIPITNSDGKLTGMLTLKEIANYLINGDFENIETDYDNLVRTLEGEELLKFKDNIAGKIRVASYRSTTIREHIDFNKTDILIVADRHSVIEYAIKCKIQLIILVGDSNIKEEHIKLAKENKVNIIKTKLSGFFVTKRINLCSFNKYIIENKNIEPTFFHNYDYVNEVKEAASKIKHTNYPIVDRNGKCLGLLRMADIDSFERKKVILVDHNDPSQSVVGLDEAEILEVIDHHNIGNIYTKNPINFKNMAVASTNTIIYNMYKDYKLPITREIAGLMFSGILSDTLLLKSPTTTEIDKIAIKELEVILNLDYEKYGLEMYKAGASIEGKTIEEIINNDYKEYQINNKHLGIGQVLTLSIDEIEKNKVKYINELNKIAKDKGLDICLMFVTDIINNGSYIYYNNSNENLIKIAFNLEEINEGAYLEGYVSRKKQILPKLLDVLE